MRAATAVPTTAPRDTSMPGPTGRRSVGRHVHLGAHLAGTDPLATDLYLPTVERRRRAAARQEGRSRHARRDVAHHATARERAPRKHSERGAQKRNRAALDAAATTAAERL